MCSFILQPKLLHMDRERTVVRVALYHRGSFLLLHKDGASKEKGLREFPGGGLEDFEDSYDACIREVSEEANISIQRDTLTEIQEFSYTFHISGSGEYKRTVRLFLCCLDDTKKYSVQLNPQEKHEDYSWVTPKGLCRLANRKSVNTYTQKREILLSNASRRVDKLLSHLQKPCIA